MPMLFTHVVFLPWGMLSPGRHTVLLRSLPPFILSSSVTVHQSKRLSSKTYFSVYEWILKVQVNVEQFDCIHEQGGLRGANKHVASPLGRARGARGELRGAGAANRGGARPMRFHSNRLPPPTSPPTITVPCNCSSSRLSTNLCTSETEALISVFPEPSSVPDV